MPHIVTEVPETTANVLRPVVLSVVRQMAQMLRLKPETNLIFPGFDAAPMQIGSEIGFQGDDVNFGYDGFATINVTEEYIEDRALSNAVLQRENHPIFLDDALGIRLRPVYVGTQLTIEFSYEAPNRILAERLRDDMMVRTAMLRQENLHELNYYYSIPSQFLVMLKDFHTMRETVQPYNEDFSKWMKDHLTQRATNLTTLAGTEMSLAIGEYQLCVPGHFDFLATASSIEKVKDGDTYRVSFNYIMTFDKVIACAFDYPLVIHNQLISSKYYDTPTASGDQSRPDRRLRQPSWSRQAFDYFTPQYRPTVYEQQLQGISIPVFDDWMPETAHPRTMPVVTLMIAVDLTEPTLVQDLTDLVEYQIDSNILNYMRVEHANLNKYGQCPIHVTLYKGDVPLNDNEITIDSNLVVRSVNPMRPREQYHLRISLYTDLSQLPFDVLERFRSHGPACQTVLIALQHAIIGTGYMPVLVGGQIVSRISLLTIIQWINDRRHPHQVGTEFRMLTVASYTIVTHKMTDLPREEPIRYAHHDPHPGSAGAPRPIGPEGPEYPIPSSNS